MQNTRYVKPNADGGWEVLKEGHRRSSVHASTQQQAVVQAREILRSEGGGELRILNRMGKVEGASTVLKVR